MPLSAPPQVRNHLLEGMWLAAVCHTKMVGELAALRAVVPYTTESMLGRAGCRIPEAGGAVLAA
jgi:hypothetical protein